MNGRDSRVAVLIEVESIGLHVLRRDLLIEAGSVERLTSLHDAKVVLVGAMDEVVTPDLVRMVFHQIQIAIFAPPRDQETRNPDISYEDQTLAWAGKGYNL